MLSFPLSETTDLCKCKNTREMKKIFMVDWIMITAFLLSACTGFALHIAGHGNNHTTWHNTAVLHVMTSLFFLIATAFHIKHHLSWYKGILKNGKKNRKSKITMALSCIFLLTSITGIALLGIEGAGTEMGIMHYALGIILTIISLGHILKRIPQLRKSCKPPKK